MFPTTLSRCLTLDWASDERVSSRETGLSFSLLSGVTHEIYKVGCTGSRIVARRVGFACSVHRRIDLIALPSQFQMKGPNRE